MANFPLDGSLPGSLADDTDGVFYDRLAALVAARDGASQDAVTQNAYNTQIRMLRTMREQALQAYGSSVGAGSNPGI